MKSSSSSRISACLLVALVAVSSLGSCTTDDIAPTLRKPEDIHYNHQRPKPVDAFIPLSEGEPAIEPQPRQEKQ